ncbi:MAG: lytic murein transglycosylase [Candidatus Paceibacterota bacterium]
MVAAILASLSFSILKSNAAVQDEIQERNKQIEELQKQIEEYQNQVDTTRIHSKTLQNEIARLNAEINQVQLEIRVLNLSINKTSSEIQETEGQISKAETKMIKHKNALVQYLKLSYENDQKSLTEILLNNESISDFFNELNSINATQDNLQITIKNIKDLKSELEVHQEQLENKQTELERARRFQEIEKRSIDSTKAVQAKLLKDTKGHESKYQELLTRSQKDIEALRAQITYLEQNGVSAEEAVKFGQLAAIRTGIRPEYLLAELNLESGLGINVGKCNIVDETSGASRHVTTGKVSARGINPTRDLPLFLTITRELGRDPFQTPISCWPGFGWGGAMGPAQFIPSTWMGYREEVSRLTGRTPANPWNIEDAFVAAATKLSRDGASSKTRAGEIAASKRYYCGSASSTKSSCINYANRVQNLAAEIAKNL